MTDQHRGTGAEWPAYGACLLAAASAAVSFYWAFGGTAGIGTLGGRLEELGRQGDPAVRWLAGVVEAPEGADRGALWWHVLVWDLWFLVWGVLLGVAVWRYGRVTAAGGLRGRGLRGGG